MKKLYLFLLIASIALTLSDSAEATGTIEIAATQGKLTDWRNPDTVQTSNTQLATRNAANNDCKKSWLQFDLTGIYDENPSIRGNIINAKLTFYGAKSEPSDKSYVVHGLNDAANLENWTHQP